ncbi:MAG: hypothetical protein ACI83H_002477 [Glaciecola sp.]
MKGSFKSLKEPFFLFINLNAGNNICLAAFLINIHSNLKTKTIMRKLILLVALTTTCTLTFAQAGSSFGIKAGLNYNANGDYFDSIGETVEDPSRNIGYHIGLFGKIGNRLYFRPEVVYTTTKSDYDSGEFDMKKIDVPLLVGIKVLGPLSVFGGPSLQYILDSEFDGVTIKNIEKDFTLGVNFGASLNINNIGIDLRYERGLSNNEAVFLDNNGIDLNDRIDTRPDQLILSLSIAF